jgi:hypothetical protein
MDLAHDRRQPALPRLVELAEAAVAVAPGVPARYSCHSSISVTPGRRELAMQACPIGLRLAARPRRRAAPPEQQRLQRGVPQLFRQRPAQPGRRAARPA